MESPSDTTDRDIEHWMAIALSEKTKGNTQKYLHALSALSLLIEERLS